MIFVLGRLENWRLRGWFTQVALEKRALPGPVSTSQSGGIRELVKSFVPEELSAVKSRITFTG